MNKLRQRLNIYFQKTTLHGFAYISASESWTERIFWVLALLYSLIWSLFLTYELIIKVLTNPIIIQQPDKPIHIKDIPFPAISFCPDFLIPDSYGIFTSLLINKSAVYPYPEVYWLKNQSTSNWEDITSYLQIPLYFRGVWMKKYRTKPNYVVSSFGWCQTFNVVEYDEMFYTNMTADYFKSRLYINQRIQLEGYEHEIINKTKILRKYVPKAPLYASSKAFGLYMPCFSEYWYYCPNYPRCSRPITFTVVIHSPFERPDFRHKHFNIMDYQKYVLSATAEIKFTHESLLDLDVDERKCYKKDEKELKFFRTYTPVNCLKECESFFILEQCGCVPYYFLVNNTSLICNTVQMISCFENEYRKFNDSVCKCFPSCNEISYNIINQMNQINYVDYSYFFNWIDDIVIVNFKENSFYPQIRRKYYTIIDWFSFIGGILGLFFGFSFLSGFEIIYHAWLSIVGNAGAALSIRSTKFNQFFDYLKSFMDNCSIHGLSYVADSTMKIFERFAWLISFILSITACNFMIGELRERLTIDSISISMTDKLVNMTQFPFLAFMLIYPGNTFYVPSVDRNPDLNKLSMVAKYFVTRNEKNADFNNPHEDNFTNYGKKLGPFLKNFTSQSIRSGNSIWVLWNGKFPVPTRLILTSKGAIHDFNMVKFEEMFNTERISPDFFYEDQITNSTSDTLNSTPVPWYPKYGNDEKLVIIRDKPRNGHYNEPTFSLHSPFEYPFDFEDQYSNRGQIKYKQMLDVFIVPEIITTDKDLKTLSVKQRMCYLENERILKYFKIYTQRNCHIECMSEEMLKTCNCVPFDIIRGSDTKVCEFKDIQCTEQIRRGFMYDSSTCSCLELCDSYSYSYEFIQTKHKTFNETKEKPKGYEEQLDSAKWYLGFLTVMFKEKEFPCKQRVRTFTTVDFLSQVGGLLGLFAGISVLSVFEILYFFTLRLICEIYRRLRSRSDIKYGNILIVAPFNTKELYNIQ